MSSKVRPTAKEVVDAIVSNSPDRLQYVIDQGYNINTSLRASDMDTYDHVEEDIDPGPEETIALSTNEISRAVAYPLHVAVVSLYHAAKRKILNKYGTKKAIETIKVLLANGASWSRGCGDVLIFNLEGYNWVLFSENSPENQPLHLAIFLKKYEHCDSNEYMDVAIDLLQNASKEKKPPPSLKTTAVLQSVASCYKSMLFSDDFCDVLFQCSDGVSVPAHRNILAASSPYFEAAFKGDWAENNSDGIWNTVHSSDLIKSVLTLIYTGSVEECEKLTRDYRTDPLRLLDLACEYDVKPLIHISVDNCKKKLKVDNVRRMLQNAHTHSCGRLKKACFEFIRKNSTKVLMYPDMMSLASEDPDLWAELGIFLNGSSERPSKRARTDDGNN